MLRARAEFRLPEVAPQAKSRQNAQNANSAMLDKVEIVNLGTAAAVSNNTRPSPLESSRSRGWNGITVERHHVSATDFVTQSPAALITVHLGPSVLLTQTRCKRIDRRRIKEGDITVTPPDKMKQWRYEGDANFAALWLDPRVLRLALQESRNKFSARARILDNFGTPDPEIERIGLSLLSELTQEGFASSLLAESLANELAVHLVRRYSTAENVPQPSITILSGYKLRQVREYIDENLDEHLSLANIAGRLGMSVHHFAHVFKQTTGLAPHQYLMACRISRAKSLLRNTNLSITEIANRVGCTSPSHFSSMFHRVTAVTPRMYRHSR